MPGNRILIADDDRLVLSTLGQGLRDAGYVVFEATDGKAAVHLCETEQPDLALLDVRMPGISGLEAAHLIRQKTKVPFIFLSAYGEKDIVSLALKEGALGYLVKPIDIPQIIPSIESSLALAAEFAALQKASSVLATSLETTRETSMAVGIIMERYRLDRATAFETLRHYARSERLKIKQLAEAILNAEETLNAPYEHMLATTTKQPDS